jgi:HSP90 family molecular chaperone
MKKGQKNIYFIAGANKEEVAKSPFAERLVKKVCVTRVTAVWG